MKRIIGRVGVGHNGDVAVTLNDLTVNFNHLERQSLLEDWKWLLGPDKQPILLAAIGDAFVQDTTNGQIYVLDVAAGTLDLVAESFEEFKSLLTDKSFVVNHFAVQLVGDLRLSGCVLDEGQIYSFKQPPVLGGAYSLSNVEPTDIEVHFSIAGQIHRQVAELPPGTQISGVNIK